MDEFTCPACASEDVRGERQRGGLIVLTCQACQTAWPRVPKPSCQRCGSGDVEGYGADSEGRTFRCRKCHHTWSGAP